MGPMDAGTLIRLETLILYFVGGLMLLAALQGRRDRTLLWAAAACLLAGTAFLLTLLDLGNSTHELTLIGANTLFVATHSAVWITMRVFSRRPANWRYAIAGPVMWLVLYQVPWINQSDGMRIVVYCAICLVYLALAMREIWPELKIDMVSTLPVVLMLGEHSVFYIYRLVLNSFDLANLNFTRWISRPDFVSLMIESILFTISLNFGILIIVRARTERNFRHDSLHDPLTSLLNRRALFDAGRAMLARQRESGSDCSLLLFDLDWFKNINDRYGHDTGDQVIRIFAHVLRSNVRQGDLCARIGGEEFVLVAPGLSPTHALDIANRVRRGFTDHSALRQVAAPRRLPVRSASLENETPLQPRGPDAEGLPPPTGRLSASIGIAGAKTVDYNLEALLENADHALYAAKAAGRNCVRQYDDGPIRRNQGHG